MKGNNKITEQSDLVTVYKELTDVSDEILNTWIKIDVHTIGVKTVLKNLSSVKYDNLFTNSTFIVFFVPLIQI